MSAPTSAEMSVVIFTPGDNTTIHKTLRHLRAQTGSDRLEILIVSPSADTLRVDASEVAGFLRVRVIEVGEISSDGAAKAAGIREATAPVVALLEDHVYPDPDWAEALLEAHRRPWGAVGPAIGNANPGSMVSWANLFIAYGQWVEPAAGGVRDDVPGNNSSYKRELLLQCGPELDHLLEREGSLHEHLQARGYRLYLEPRAKTYHQNISLPLASASLRFHAGRLYGATRSRNGRWSPLRRLLYVGAAPLIPLVRLRRVLREIRRSGRQRELLPRVLPALMGLLAADAAGEALGYAFGPGDAMQHLSDLESHRMQHLTEQDRTTDEDLAG